MMKEKLKRISKTLSYVLRHQPDSIGITLEPAGWVEVDVLLAALRRSGTSVERAVLDQVVAENDKQRFEFDDSGRRIRARQGHSTEVDLGYEPATPPAVLFHGTAIHNLTSIRERGLVKGNRHHVHLSTNRETMVAVGRRHGKPIVLAVDSAAMHAAGHSFFLTANQVWLTEHVPPQFLREELEG